MEATAHINTEKNTVVNAIAGTLGIIHFIGQSVADLAIAAEVNFVSKHTDRDRESIELRRMDITRQRQQSIVDKVKQLQTRAAALKNK